MKKSIRRNIRPLLKLSRMIEILPKIIISFKKIDSRMKTLLIKSKYVLVTVQTVTKLQAFFAALWIENGPGGPRPPGGLNDRGKLFAKQKNDT